MTFGNNGSGMGNPANPFSSAANVRMAMDNLIRRELRVTDPSDPAQVAQALLARYAGDPKAAAIAQEASGLPFLQQRTYAPQAQAAPTSSDTELRQALDDVEQDLKELTTNSVLKDITPELLGWARGIRSAIQAGVNAARMAIDTRQRDKVFALRRQLGDFARMARLVGIFTPSVNTQFRSLAQSLDEVSSVLLVRTGEALANVGFKSGVNLLQVHYSELGARRDTILLALRNFIGTTQSMGGNNEWPRGLDAYRRVISQLDSTGQADLRSLFQENELARTLDNLVEQAADGTLQGMRGLSSTAEVDLARFRRLIMVSQSLTDPESPPFAAFLEALQLFIDAFNNSGGIRLLRVARPPILFYGLYGTGADTAAETALLNLLVQRGILASQADCISRCACDDEAIRNQVMVDLALYCTDRAIDLYALGDKNFTSREHRATAYAFMLEEMLDPALPTYLSIGTPPQVWVSTLTTISTILQTDSTAYSTTDDDIRALMIEELAIQKCTEERWPSLLPAWTDGCGIIDNYVGTDPTVASTYNLLLEAMNTISDTLEKPECNFSIDIPPTVETSLATS